MMKNKVGSSKLKKNELNESAKSSMKTRIIAGIILAVIVVPSIFLGDWIFFGLVFVALGFACWEILGVCKKRTVVMYVIYLFFVALFTYWPIFQRLIFAGSEPIGKLFDSLYISVLVVILGMFLLFMFSVIFKDFTIPDACFLFTMALLIGFGFQSLLYLRYFPAQGFDIETISWKFTVDNTIKNSMLILFVLLSTLLTDAGAYFVGVFFGKNKMNERISPKKTWEGFVGGIIISFVISTSIGLGLSASNFPLTSDLTINRWYLVLFLSLLIPLFSTLGDFVFSSVKRHYGIKDYGKLIPGHGGVLDRLDSIFFSAIISAIFVLIVSQAGGTGWLI